MKDSWNDTALGKLQNLDTCFLWMFVLTGFIIHCHVSINIRFSVKYSFMDDFYVVTPRRGRPRTREQLLLQNYKA